MQEGGEFLERSGSKPDEDAKTRGMQKKLEGIQEEAPPKPKVPRTTTMAATAQVGEGKHRVSGACECTLIPTHLRFTGGSGTARR